MDEDAEAISKMEAAMASSYAESLEFIVFLFRPGGTVGVAPLVGFEDDADEEDGDGETPSGSCCAKESDTIDPRPPADRPRGCSGSRLMERDDDLTAGVVVEADTGAALR